MRLWIPGAKIVTAHKDATLLGGPKKVIWHTTENDPNKTSALSVARYLNGVGSQVHLVWNPTTGEMVQMIPANRAGRGLQNKSGGVQTNTAGSVVFQIEVVARAAQPWTNGPCKNLDVILDFLAQLGVPDAWPAGDLKAYPASYGGSRSTSAWGRSGQFGHSQVPENVHGDPGNIVQSKLVIGGKATAPAPVPAPAPVRVYCYRGDRGPAVVRVQKIVGVTADGSYGPGTEAAVKKWQAANKITADGKWGPATEATYVKTLQKSNRVAPVKTKFPLPRGHWYGRNDRTALSHSGVRSADKAAVMRIQKDVGLTPDGNFGPATEAKVKFWQAKMGQPATGKVDAATWLLFEL